MGNKLIRKRDGVSFYKLMKKRTRKRSKKTNTVNAVPNNTVENKE